MKTKGKPTAEDMPASESIEFTPLARDWSSIKLGEESPLALLEMRNGLTLPQSQDSGEYRVTRIETIAAGRIDESRVRYVSDVTSKEAERSRIQKGDILFSHINSDPHIGKTAIAERDYEDLLHGMNLLLIRPNPVVFDAQFLNRVFQYYRVLGVFIAICSRSVNQSSINQAKLKALEIPLPPLPEQKKIAHILSTVQRAIEEQERIIQTTTELKKALMHKLFTEGLRNEPQKRTGFGLIPKSWEVLPLSGCAVVQTGIAKGRKVDPKEAVEVPYLRVANVQDGYLDLSEMKTITIRRAELQRFALETGDVVLTEGGDFDKLGRGFIWYGQVEGCVHQNHVFAVRPDAQRLSSEFFAYQAQSPYGKSYFLSVAHRTTNLACINTTKLKAFPVILPPKDQQKDIVAACHGIDGKIKVARSKKRQLEDLFGTLLQELMTAKTRL